MEWKEPSCPSRDRGAAQQRTPQSDGRGSRDINVVVTGFRASRGNTEVRGHSDPSAGRPVQLDLGRGLVGLTPHARAAPRPRRCGSAGRPSSRPSFRQPSSGYRQLRFGPPQPIALRTELAPARQGRVSRQTGLAAVVQLTDLHVTDVQNPLRFEYLDRRCRTGHRPQELLGTHGATALVRRVNSLRGGPFTGRADRRRDDHRGQHGQPVQARARVAPHDPRGRSRRPLERRPRRLRGSRGLRARGVLAAREHDGRPLQGVRVPRRTRVAGRGDPAVRISRARRAVAADHGQPRRRGTRDPGAAGRDCRVVRRRPQGVLGRFRGGAPARSQAVREDAAGPPRSRRRRGRAADGGDRRTRRDQRGVTPTCAGRRSPGRSTSRRFARPGSPVRVPPVTATPGTTTAPASTTRTGCRNRSSPSASTRPTRPAAQTGLSAPVSCTGSSNSSSRPGVCTSSCSATIHRT